MLAGIPKETALRERRVAATPDSVKRLLAMGFEVRLEPDAGTAAGYADTAYEAAGAAIDPEALEAADLVLAVQMPAVERLRRGAMLAGLLAPFGGDDGPAALAAAGVEAFAMELMPRITRAQTMDALSSQSNIAGYAAVVRAADLFGRAFPMMVTAAGTVAPARVLVLGAGVAGLQAIATARRLGAVVSAMDVRPAAREQVESLGAGFIEVDHREPRLAEDEGGYAREMGEDYKREQADKLAETLARTNIVITTRANSRPARPAPAFGGHGARHAARLGGGRYRRRPGRQLRAEPCGPHCGGAGGAHRGRQRPAVPRGAGRKRPLCAQPRQFRGVAGGQAAGRARARL